MLCLCVTIYVVWTMLYGLSLCSYVLWNMLLYCVLVIGYMYGILDLDICATYIVFKL